MNEITDNTIDAIFVQSRMVQLPSGEQFTTDKTGRIGEIVSVRVKRTGIQYATVSKTLNTIISSAENRAKSNTSLLSGRLGDRVDYFEEDLGIEFDNCVIVEVPDGIITNFTFKEYTNTALIPKFIAGSSGVYLNGLRQQYGVDYIETPASGKICFASAPLAGDVVVIKVRCALSTIP